MDGRWVGRRQQRRRNLHAVPWRSCCVFVGLLALNDSAFVHKASLCLLRTPHRSVRVACGQQAPETSRSELYQLLQQREHVLRRPDMYIGPVEPRNETAWIVNDRKIVESPLVLSPGLVQIYNEILVNAIDRQFHSSLSEIRITVDRQEISIWNDGGAIPIEMHELSGLFVPTMVFGEFMSGENFDDTGIRFTGGRNGIGAKATNVFSKSFEVMVDDPTSQQRFYQRWDRNMATQSEPEITSLPPEIQRGSVGVTFKPDLGRFGLTSINHEHMQMMKARAFDAAASTTSDVKVTFNDDVLNVQDFQEFSQMALGKDFAVATVHDSKGRLRAEVSAAFAGQNGFAALGLVNGIRCSRGTHVKYVTDQITAKLAEMVAIQRGASYRPSEATVKQFLRIIVKVLVDNPDFDSQTKTRLTTTSHKLGFDLVLPSEFFDTVAELGVLDASIKAVEATRNRVMQRALASGAPPSIAKLEDAVNAGKKGHKCTLILTEGDSAKALAVAGLAKVGRENYGVFPLKGKLLNVRGASDQQIQSNVEIKHLMHILGLRWGQTFHTEEEVAALRYQHVMIFSDQDLDGHHIAGLVINLLVSLWPSLLEVKPDFLERFATPLVKVFPSHSSSSQRWEFFTQGDFETWQQETGADWMRRYRAKYYKGLGTSTREEALQYFSDMEKHVIDVKFSGHEDFEAVEKAFEPTRTDDRKTWIQGYDPTEELNYSQESASFVDFFDKSFVHFSAYDCVRSIPRLMDGLKPSQRKVLWWAMRNLKSEKKVSQIVGLVSSATSYHHGEESLVKVIVNLAQDFVGTNNLNLFQPIGMFGTRLNGRDVHASARYINTKLSPLVPYIFRKEDFDLVPPQLEEGHEIEPRMLLPIFPLVLVNGFSGIGTGWSTVGPNFAVLQVVDHLMALIQQKPLSKETLVPSFRGFRGTVQDIHGRWVSQGKWQILEDEDINQGLLLVEITELPVKAWTDDFILALEKKAEKQRVAMKLFKCSDHDDQNVHLLLAFDRDQFEGPEQVKAIQRFLRLQKPITSYMWLFTEAEDHSSSLEFFEGANEILEAFYRARRPSYAQRKERMMQRMSHKVRLLENQLRCIELHRSGQLDPNGCFLEEKGFDRMQSSWSQRDQSKEALEGDEGFKYLLEMPIHRFSARGAETSQERLREAQEDLRKLQQFDIDDMWLEDLQTFRAQYLKVHGADASHAPVKLSKSDRQKALRVFNQERRRWSDKNDPTWPEEMCSFMSLSKLSTIELKDHADKVGLDLRGSKPLRKQDLIERLVSYQTIGFSEKNWEKLPVTDLKAHLKFRGLSQVGSKTSLVERLARSQTGHVAFRRVSIEMKKELRSMGLRTTGLVEELEQRYTIFRRRQIEEERALRNLQREELKELHPKAFREAVFNRLSRCFTIARCGDLPQAHQWKKIYKLRKEEKCWVECIKLARAQLGEKGALERPASPRLFREVARCFRRRKECDEAPDESAEPTD